MCSLDVSRMRNNTAAVLSRNFRSIASNSGAVDTLLIPLSGNEQYFENTSWEEIRNIASHLRINRQHVAAPVEILFCRVNVCSVHGLEKP